MRNVRGSGSCTSAKLEPGSPSDTGTRASGPLITDSSSATSSTLRAIGPPTPRLCHGSGSGWLGTRPMVGRRPTTLQNAAGLRREPPMSLPSAIGHMPVASATAAPPLLPPAERVRSYGLRVVPKTGLNVWEPAANSGTLVLPSAIVPAARSRAMIRSSESGTLPARIGEPMVVRMPAVAWVSLCRIGMPCSTGSSAPDVRRRSAASARASACSATSVTTALTGGLTAAIRSRKACVTSRAPRAPVRSMQARSPADRKHRSSPTTGGVTPGDPVSRTRRAETPVATTSAATGSTRWRCPRSRPG